jgi:hypothetical protein
MIDVARDERHGCDFPLLRLIANNSRRMTHDHQSLAKLLPCIQLKSIVTIAWLGVWLRCLALPVTVPSGLENFITIPRVNASMIS